MAEEKEKKVETRGARFDGWGRFLSGYHDKKANKADVSYLANGVQFTPEVLEAIWENDGFSRRVITCVAEDMVNKGFSVAGDPGNIIMDELDSLNWTGNFFNCLCQARAFGGSAILIGLNDGKDLESPVALNSITGCSFLRVIPRSRLAVETNDLDLDPKSKNYGKPKVFTVNDGVSLTPYKVHMDRLLMIPWIETSPVRVNSKGVMDRIWGQSVLEYIYKQVGNLAVFHDSLSNLVQEAVIGKYKISNLTQMLANGEEGSLMTRLDIINMAKSIINGVVLDADNNEDYVRDSLSFAGMNGVADTMMVLLSCVSEIPVTRLFGRSPSGLDASGESDLKIYYDMVSSYQKAMLTEPMKRLVFYIDKYKRAIEVETDESLTKSISNRANKGKAKVAGPLTAGEISLKWNPLYQMTEKENADVYKSNADADLAYLEKGILSSEEIRVNRFVGGYNQHISVQSADLPVNTKMEETPAEEPEEK